DPNANFAASLTPSLVTTLPPTHHPYTTLFRSYAKREAAEQLRALRGISITKEEHDQRGDLYIVRAYGRDKTGREDVATGAVSIADRKSTRLNSSHVKISYAVLCLKKKKNGENS